MEKKVHEEQGYQLIAAEVLEERIALDIVGPAAYVPSYLVPGSTPGGALPTNENPFTTPAK